MRCSAIFILLFFLALRSGAQTASDSSRAKKANRAPALIMFTVAADTFRLENLGFVRVTSRKPRALRLTVDSTGYFLTDNNSGRPFRTQTVFFTINVNGVVVERRANRILSREMVQWLAALPAGQRVTIDADQFIDASGRTASIPHEPIILRKL